MTVVQRVFKFLLLANVVALVIIFSSSNVLANVSELLSQGDNHRVMGDYPLAEKAYTGALEKEPKNYRILKSLVEVKVFLEKYAEAEPLAKKFFRVKSCCKKR